MMVAQTSVTTGAKSLTALLSEVRGDLSRHPRLSDPSVWPLLVYRFGRGVDLLPAPLRRSGSRVYGALALAVELGTGTRLHRELELGDATRLIHGSNLKIHPEAVIGDRVRINHDVTIGERHGVSGLPVVGDDVLIGAGAKLLGPIEIGDGAVISANALVITDIPPGVTAMGVPARPLPTRPRKTRTFPPPAPAITDENSSQVEHRADKPPVD